MYIPTKVTFKSIVSEHSFIFVCLIFHPRGEHWWNWVLIIMLCKLSDSFGKWFYSDNYSMMICLCIQKLTQKRILIFNAENVYIMSWNITEINTNIWKYTYVHSFPCPTIKYDHCDFMHNYSYDRYDITPTLILEKVKVQNSAFPCSALTLLDCHSSLKYIQQTRNPWIWFLALASS